MLPEQTEEFTVGKCLLVLDTAIPASRSGKLNTNTPNIKVHKCLLDYFLKYPFLQECELDSEEKFNDVYNVFNEVLWFLN